MCLEVFTYPRAMRVLQEEMGPVTPSRKLISSFQWSNIGKLSFEVSSYLSLPHFREGDKNPFWIL